MSTERTQVEVINAMRRWLIGNTSVVVPQLDGDLVGPYADTSEAHGFYLGELAVAMMTAHVSSLMDQGYAIVKIGDPPPWMESVSNSYCDCPEANGLNRDCGACDVEHWRMRLSTPGEES